MYMSKRDQRFYKIMGVFAMAMLFAVAILFGVFLGVVLK